MIGDRCISIARDGSRLADCRGIRRPIWCVAIYASEARQRDGVVTWRRVGSVDGARTVCAGSAPASLVPEALAAAERLGCRYLAGIRHGTPVR